MFAIGNLHNCSSHTIVMVSYREYSVLVEKAVLFIRLSPIRMCELVIATSETSA